MPTRLGAVARGRRHRGGQQPKLTAVDGPPGATGLSQSGDEYHLNWKTDRAWANTCRRLTLRIPAASDAVAYFSFF